MNGIVNVIIPTIFSSVRITNNSGNCSSYISRSDSCNYDNQNMISSEIIQQGGERSHNLLLQKGSDPMNVSILKDTQGRTAISVSCPGVK